MIPAPLQNLFDRLAVAWRERAIALKAASFAVVGVVNSVIDFGVFSFCYYYLGLPIVVANTIAGTTASDFFLNMQPPQKCAKLADSITRRIAELQNCRKEST